MGEKQRLPCNYFGVGEVRRVVKHWNSSRMWNGRKRLRLLTSAVWCNVSRFDARNEKLLPSGNAYRDFNWEILMHGSTLWKRAGMKKDCKKNQHRFDCNASSKWSNILSSQIQSQWMLDLFPIKSTCPPTLPANGFDPRDLRRNRSNPWNSAFPLYLGPSLGRRKSNAPERLWGWGWALGPRAGGARNPPPTNAQPDWNALRISVGLRIDWLETRSSGGKTIRELERTDSLTYQHLPTIQITHALNHSLTIWLKRKPNYWTKL